MGHFAWSSRLDRLENYLSSLSAIEARINTLALRLDDLEREVAILQHCFTSTQPGVSLRSEVAALNKVVTQAVETLNRAEAEVRRLLNWRERFTTTLQGELRAIGHKFCVAGPQLDIIRIELELHRMRREATQPCPSVESTASVGPPGPGTPADSPSADFLAHWDSLGQSKGGGCGPLHNVERHPDHDLAAALGIIHPFHRASFAPWLARVSTHVDMDCRTSFATSAPATARTSLERRLA